MNLYFNLALLNFSKMLVYLELTLIFKGEEFGLALDLTFEKGDIIECHEYFEIQREAEWSWSS